MLAIDWQTPIEDALSDFATFIPKLVGALVILLVGWLIARFIRGLVTRALKAIKFDHWIDRSGIGQPLARAGYSDSGKLLAQLVFYAVMLVVFQLAINVFGNDAVSKAFQGLLDFIPKLFVAIIIVILTGVIANVVRGLVGPALSHQSAGDLLTKIAVGAIWVIGGFAAVDQLGIAQNVVDTLFQVLTIGLGLVFVISFGVGGINAARDRFWPGVYDAFGGKKDS